MIDAYHRTTIYIASGTWIPLERGLALCKQYNCEHLLLPIIDFQPDASSPPLAPKHLVSSAPAKPTPSKRAAAEAPAASTSINTRSSRRAAPVPVEESEHDTVSVKGSDDGSMTPSPSEASSSSRTPSPIRNSPVPSQSTSLLDEGFQSPPLVNRRKRKIRGQTDSPDSQSGEFAESYPERHGERLTQSYYAEEMLEYFISDAGQIPDLLLNPPPNFDPNMAIDDDGHTALHWASAMGRIRIVKLLLSAGADIFRVNKAGQTALMRSVMFANNYDVRKFPELYELLHRSTLNIDNNNRTVFHHIVDVAMSKGKTHAARYYMETVLNRLADYPTELADIINFQDEDGETALTMAARCRSKRLVKLLIDHEADPKVTNRDGKSCEDYILEDERFRSSPVMPSRAASMSYRNAQAATGQAPFEYPTELSDHPPLHHSVTAQKAATRCVNDVATLLGSLATAYDQELKDKERDMGQASALLGNIQTEILESQRTVNSLKSQAQGLPQSKQRIQELETDLRSKMGNRYRMGWEMWLKDEEDREKAVRDAHGGQVISDSVVDGIPRTAAGEDLSDLIPVHANLPTDPSQVKAECDRIRSELVGHKRRRLELFDDLIKFQAEAGTGGRMADYRRLISAGCGGVPPNEVDNVIGMLLEVCYRLS